MKTVVIEIEMEIDEEVESNYIIAHALETIMVEHTKRKPNYVVCRDKHRRHNPADSSTARPDHSS